MKNIFVALAAECIKMRRSRIFWITIGLFIFIPVMMGLLMLVAQHPEVAKKLGIVGTKAQLFGENNWAGFFMMLNQLIASVGLIGFGFVTAWIFGREHIERTITNIMSLPVSRQTIVSAKFIVVFGWSAILVLVLLISGLLMGYIISIPGWSEHVFKEFLNKYIQISVLTILLSSLVAFIAGYGRGIIAPIAFVIFMLIMAQFVALVGWGPYFPWAIPGVISVSEGTEGMEIVFGSYVIVLITSLIGYFGTIAWWKYADQK